VTENLKDVVIIYHDKCRDGFGAAYAAWKKYGDDASYIPVKEHNCPPEGLIDREIYIVDFSFDLPILIELNDKNKKVVVIDHHRTVQEDVESFPQNIFDINHSGAVLAWKYFHPETTVPPLLEYIEDHDIWNRALPDNREYNAALREYEVTFEAWDELVEKLKDEKFLAGHIKTGATITKFEDKLVDSLLTFKERVLFEGHEVWALNVSRTYRSILGHHLAKLNEDEGEIAFGIVYYRSNGSVNLSLRSNGDVDVSAIAEKHGGGGHKNAASLRVDSFSNLPFTFI
jgi:oligoribonuclease NrnB/cAMP/cGMP phosphodiesterase (DHH superfamily)